MARKPKHEEHENHERWLVSYADFITLLFAFFVVMYSISSVNEGKYRVLSDSMVSAFKSSNKSLKPIQVGHLARSPQSANLEFKDTSQPIKVPESPMSIPSRANKTEGHYSEQEVQFSEFPMADERFMQQRQGSDEGQQQSDADKRAAEIQLGNLANEIEMAMQPLIDRDLIAVKRSKQWIEVEINTSILFTSGSANMQEQSLPILEALARILYAFPNDLRVEGFTDNVAIKSQQYPSNWELSAARAASVVRLFASEGIEPERMAAIGYGEFRPVASNDTREGRIKNRRVLVVITANRHMRGYKPKVEALPAASEMEPQIEEMAPQVEKMEPQIEEVADLPPVDGSFARLDALVASSGLYRKTPVVLDQLQSTAALIEDVQAVAIPIMIKSTLIAPPIKFRSPISLPRVKLNHSPSISPALSAGKK